MFIWNAFIALSSARIGQETIRFSEIEAWLNLNGIFNLEQRQEIAHLIRILDIEYFQYLIQKEKQNAKS